VVVPPLSGLFIAAGLVLSSVLVVNRFKGTGLFGLLLRRVLACVAALLILVGLILHFETRPGTGVHPHAVRNVVPEPVQPAPPVSFSFEPKSVRWGEEVRIRVKPEVGKIDVYLNGTPLPCTSMGGGVFVVRIPSIAKSGYLALTYAKTKVRGTEELAVTSR
jgi:hypothetical protein